MYRIFDRPQKYKYEMYYLSIDNNKRFRIRHLTAMIHKSSERRRRKNFLINQQSNKQFISHSDNDFKGFSMMMFSYSFDDYLFH